MVFGLQPQAQANVNKTIEQTESVITIKKIEFSGNTVFPDSELEAILAPFLGKIASTSVLLKATEKVDNYYINRGYITTGSIVISQGLKKGLLQIQIIEAILADIQILGLSSLSENYLLSRLPKEGEPFNFKALVKSLERLQNDILINEIKAQINQSSLGQNILMVELSENSPTIARFFCTDGYSPSIGSFGCNASITHRSLLLIGDSISLNSSVTKGLDRVGVSYSVPINTKGGRITISYDNGLSRIVEEVLENLDIKADYQFFALEATQPIISTQNESLTLLTGIEIFNSETSVEDISFPFTEGLDDGQTNLTIITFAQQYRKKGQKSFLSVKSKFNLGVDAFRATRTKLGIDGIFWSWSGDFQYFIFLNQQKDSYLATRVFFQLTPDKLLPLAQTTIGGLGTVRGYRPNLGVADNVIGSTIEFHLPLLRNDDWGQIKIIPFIDFATFWNNDRPTSGDRTFASCGLALTYSLKEVVEIRLDYGEPLIPLEDYGTTDTENNLIFSAFVYPLNF